MKRVLLCASVLMVFAPFFGGLSVPVRAEERVVWTDSRVRGTPEPPPPFVLERAFAGLTFQKPIEAVAVPATDRILLVEQNGKILSFPNHDAATQADEVVDLHAFEPEMRDSYAIALHPRFEENRFVYVMLTVLKGSEPNLEDGSRIVRFTLPDSKPFKIDPGTGVIIFKWLAGGHNGCGLRFGPDGMLYISTGDAGPAEPPDSFATGQNLGDVLSSVLRLDVDHVQEDRLYAIPADNPFVGMAGARGEVWAYGLRNPWRIAFNKANGDLYAGDVGWERWEMIHRIVRGGNSGWSLTEATRQDVRPDRAPGPTPVRAPLVVHPHEEAASITGGEFYHGNLLPELRGSYVYSDWQTGTFWAVQAEGDRLISQREIARSSLMPTGFLTLPDGEILACDHAGGGLWRLAPNPEASDTTAFPTKLSETGLFQDVIRQTPAPGVLPYLVRATRWNDFATALRWVAVPSADRVSAANASLGVMGADRWVFPKDTVFAKTYFLEMETGNPLSKRAVETQLLHFSGPQAVAYTYRWNEAQTDAELVPASGAEVSFAVKDAGAPGGVRDQAWRFLSRSECSRCHTVWTNFTPGYNAVQLARPAGDTQKNQLAALTALGLVGPSRRKPADFGDAEPSLELQARFYLHANCAGCHRKNGGGAVPSYFDIELPVKECRLVDQTPVQGALGLPEGKVLAPGDPERSVLLYRMATTGRGHMPYVGSRLVDEEGLRLVRQWIASLPSNPANVPEPVSVQRSSERALVAALKTGDTNGLDKLLETVSGALSVALELAEDSLPPGARQAAIRKGAALGDPFRSDLFERFLSPQQRRKVLGSAFDPAEVLAVHGDPAQGAAVFRVLCAACHRVGGEGIEFGPDLRDAAKRYSAAELLEHIRQPSKLIEPTWQLATVSLEGGETKGGFVVRRSASDLTLRMPGGVSETIPSNRILKIQTESRVSAMPEGLLQGSTAREAADLLAWLKALAGR